ncbi:MAG: hypothetical protein RIB67_10540 [Miltoncostaeaceae bacterium]
MNDLPLIEANPPGFRRRLGDRIRGRRLMLGGILALVEVVGILIWRGSALLLAVLALAALVAAIAIAVRLRPGPLRDIMWIIAIAQSVIVVIPFVVGASFIAAILVGLLLIVGLIAVAARWRV